MPIRLFLLQRARPARLPQSRGQHAPGWACNIVLSSNAESIVKHWCHSLFAAVCLIPIGTGDHVSWAQSTSDFPNIVLIMTDNHGAWTLGCYGNPDIRTPNIDRLASDGTLFTNAFSSNPVCSPTRATFLTGLIPSQHGVHSFLSGGRLASRPERPLHAG